MTLGPAEIAAIWAVGSTAGTMLFLGTLQLGRLMARMERVERRVEDVDGRMDKAGERMSDLAGKVQSLLYPRRVE